MSDKPISAELPFEANYLQVNGEKIHYIDEGVGDPVLFMHGNSTWSYMWRNIIPYLSSKARCIAFDLVGHGRSDKPDIDYRFVTHYDYVEGFLEDPQVVYNQTVFDLDDDEGGSMKLFATAPRFGATPTNVRRAPPRLYGSA